MQLSRLQQWAIGLGISLISIVFIVFQLATFSNNSSLDDWDKDFQGYVKNTRAQIESGKPIALFFYTDWCPNCKKLREDILASTEVRQFMSDLHPIKINPEHGLLEDQLAKEFGIVGYPSFFIINANTDEAIPIRRTSNITPDQFITQIKQAIKSS